VKLSDQEPDVLEELGVDFLRDLFAEQAAERRRQAAQYGQEVT
jgi:hypothetical protein